MQSQSMMGAENCKQCIARIYLNVALYCWWHHVAKSWGSDPNRQLDFECPENLLNVAILWPKTIQSSIEHRFRVGKCPNSIIDPMKRICGRSIKSWENKWSKQWGAGNTEARSIPIKILTETITVSNKRGNQCEKTIHSQRFQYPNRSVAAKKSKAVSDRIDRHFMPIISATDQANHHFNRYCEPISNFFPKAIQNL
jgi:hypothetical protein